MKTYRHYVLKGTAEEIDEEFKNGKYSNCKIVGVVNVGYGITLFLEEEYEDNDLDE